MRRVVWVLLFLNVMVFAYLRFAMPQVARHTDVGTSVPTLTLVSELPVSPPPRCVRIGPWKDAATAEALKRWLSEAHYAFHEHLIESTADPDFAVTIVVASPDAAAKVVKRLKVAHIDDFEVLPPQASAVEATIALGHYSDRHRAESRVAALAALGLQPQIVTPSPAPAGGWFEVTIAAALPDPDTADIVRDVPGADGITVVACPAETPITPPGTSPAPSEMSPRNSPNGQGVAPTESVPPGRPPVVSPGAPA